MTSPEGCRLLRLKSGEELIAQVFDAGADVLLSRPMHIQILMALDENKNPYPAKVILTDWLVFSTEKVVKIPKESVITNLPPTVGIMACYEQEKLRQESKLPATPLDPAQVEAAKKEAKAKEKEKKRKDQLILIQISRGNLTKLLEQLGLNINSEAWKKGKVDEDAEEPEEEEDDEEEEEDDEEEEEDDEESEEPESKNLDGSGDIMLDDDGAGFHDPWGNPRFPNGPMEPR